MITLNKTANQTVQVLLNQENVNEATAITLRLNSPSRSQVDLTKSLTKISQGFYSFTVTASESLQLADDSYSYQIIQDSNILKFGKVRVTKLENNGFDYTLDFTLS